MMENINLQLISSKEVEHFFMTNPNLAFTLIEKSFEEKMNNNVILPDKISQVFDVTSQDRINCLPATLLKQKVSGLKWVSVFPTNSSRGLLNVTGIILLSSMETGYPLAVIDGTFITALRTAAIGATAVKYLAKESAETIGFIGSGEQAKMHFKLIKRVRNIKKCYVSSNDNKSEEKFIKELNEEYPDVTFVMCKGDYGKASENADIIVTAVSVQEPLLKAKHVKKGATYIHVGGWEDEYAVAKKADKIICDDWESVKHRSQTLSRMYHEGLLYDEDIYGNLDQIIFKGLPGRETEDEIIYFNSVGLAFIDVMFAYEVYGLSKLHNNGTNYQLQ